MAQLNVFQLTNEALKESLKESKNTNKRKTVKESKVVGAKYKNAKKIAANKIKLESLQFVKEAEENDEVIDYTPEDEVVLVIDPEMDETPETEEEAAEAAEELVGDLVCKCSICGANYVCDCEDFTEDLDMEEAECPICGETGEQIIVGEITPTDEVEKAEDEAEEAEDEAEKAEDEAEKAEDDIDDVTFDADEAEDDLDINININADDDDDDYAESIQRAKRRTLMRRESVKKGMPKRPMAKRPMAKRPAMSESKNTKVLSRKPATRKVATESYNLDDVTLNRMLTTFAKENYENVRFVKINSAKINRCRVTLEGVVVTKKGSRRATTFTCENFNVSKNFVAKFKETGAITEGTTTKGDTFAISFNTNGKNITPVALRYSYNVKEGKNAYNVSGKVLSESVKKNTTSGAKRPAKRTK